MSNVTKKEATPCPVCLDHFTPVLRQPIQCQYCPHSACRPCISQYLLTTLNDPHCMECKRDWNREFIDTKLTQTFRKGALRQHRRKVLIDREKGRLPAMQVFVEARIDYQNAEREWIHCRTRRTFLKKKRELIQSQHIMTDSMEALIERLRPINEERKELKQRCNAAEEKMRNANLVLTGKEREVRQFIMKCPSDECRGFLSSAWKCGTCQKFFCSDCHAEKSGQRDEEHKCNEDAKATAAMIKQETKPCPKCGIRISKIDGCDQMWCISCQTTFSWDSGQILLNTVVHNPHYYEYLRKANNGVVPREAGDVPCGGLPNAYLFTRLVLDIPTLSSEKKNEILDIVRCLSDIQYVRLPQFPLRQAANVNQEFDIQYLMKDITEEEWGTKLEKTETNGERKKEIGLILQTLLHVGSEKLTQLQNSQKGPERNMIAESLLPELRNVRSYTNKSLIEKGNQMGIVVPQIRNDWRYSLVRKADMKTISFETEAQESGSNAAPATTITSVDENDSEQDENDTVMVEIGGEMMEMTRKQANEIFA